MKILIAVDGSKNADDALKSLRKSGLADIDAEVLVVSVEEAWIPNPPPSSYEVFAGMAIETAQETESLDVETETGEASLIAENAATWLAENFPNWSVNSEALYGLPAQEVKRKASEWNPDLIVLGALGHSAIRRIVLGSVSEKVARQAVCPVRIGRSAQGTERSSERILVGFDGSPGAEKAVRMVAERSWSPQSEIKLVFAVESGLAEKASLLPDDEVVKYDQAGILADLRLKVAASIKLLESNGLKASTVYRTGEAKRVLICEAKDWEADCIFVGARGLNPIKRLLLGSVSSAVAAEAGCSVEIVH